MVKRRHMFLRTAISVASTIYSLVVMVTAEMDFKSAMGIVSSQSLVIDIKEHEIPGTKQLVNDALNRSQMTEMETNHVEAIRIALRGVEALSRNLTCNNDIYRRVDGIGNNVQNPLWGAAMHFQNRLLPASYRDGIGLPRTIGESGDPLPSARTVSVKCFLPSREEKSFFDRDTSQLFFQVGQFLDHDVIATALSVAFECCSRRHNTNLSSEAPCFPIYIKKGDRFFRNKCMNFRRAFGVLVKGVRQQLNTVTSFVDASTIYGSTDDEMASLRQFRGGLLKMSADNMLPLRNHFPCVKRRIPECPVSGDSRVNEVPGLIAMHMIYHREHNRCAQKLAEVNAHWDDEKLFQEARKLTIAQHQKIIYGEFLPKALGPEVLRILGIDRPYRYNPRVDPSIINVFGGAAFRFGHTHVSGIQYFHKNMSQPLSEVFFRPEVVLYQGEAALRDVILNQARRFAHKFDSFFTTEITDKLYLGVDGEAEPGESFDLLARNVQRGRDHGLAPYVKYLEYCLKRLRGIDGITQLTLPTCLKTGVYRHVSDIDIFPGGISETALTGAMVGPTFACIIGEQFYRLKFGDRFFFETRHRSRGFTTAQLANIQETATLSAIICRNTAVRNIQPHALDSRRSKENRKQPCSNYPDINFDLWRQPQ